MNIGCYGADEKTKEGDKADSENMEYKCWHFDCLILTHLNFNGI